MNELLSIVVTLALATSSALAAPPETLTPPVGRKINVAFLIADEAVVIDFAGPWSVFEAVRGDRFALYTVARDLQPIRATSGMRIIPDYTLATAPAPDILVIPAQREPSAATLAWIRARAAGAAMTMSVCSGAFILAATGLLDGKGATLYHDQLDAFAARFPRVQVRRGARFVDEGRLASAGGLSSGIDLALHVVERYFGRRAAEETAYDLEYQGQGWRDPQSNKIYAAAPPAGPRDPVCGMTVDPARSSSSQYRGQTYYFCNPREKVSFDAHPEQFVR